MAWWFMGMFSMWILLNLIAGFVDGANRLGVTQLASPLLESETGVIQVNSTVAFPDSGSVLIGNERIVYTARTPTSFTGLSRGQTYFGEATQAISYAAGSYVRTPDSDLINKSVAGGAVVTDTAGGPLGMLRVTGDFMTQTMAQWVKADYSFMTGPAALLKLVIYAFGLGTAGLFFPILASAIRGLFGVLRGG